MSTDTTGTLRVPGADLYYAVRGTGPLVLILPGGGGDADYADRLTDQLVADYTVLTYDRRGQTRTTVDHPQPRPTIQQHAEDVSCLLARLGTDPAAVFGSSTGAVIGLDLVLRHPEQVRVLVAHEPPLPSLVTEAERTTLHSAIGDVPRLHHGEGWQAVFRRMSAVLELPLTDPADPTAEVAWDPPTRRTSANLDFFITNDFMVTWEYSPDDAEWEKLRRSSTVIVPAVSRNKETFLVRCAGALAEIIGADLVEFPGGHNGYVTHPVSFAPALLKVLSG